jgi:hypothetical protein
MADGALDPPQQLGLLAGRGRGLAGCDAFEEQGREGLGFVFFGIGVDGAAHGTADQGRIELGEQQPHDLVAGDVGAVVTEEQVAGLMAHDVQLVQRGGGVLLAAHVVGLGQGDPQAAGGVGLPAHRGGLADTIALALEFGAELVDAEGARDVQCLDFFLTASA